jgi:hypothetical protein
MAKPVSHTKTREETQKFEGAESLGLLRRLVLNQLRRDTRCQSGIKGKQLNASWDHAYLQSLLSFQGAGPVTLPLRAC